VGLVEWKKEGRAKFDLFSSLNGILIINNNNAMCN
jgi:hypothetical protein